APASLASCVIARPTPPDSHLAPDGVRLRDGLGRQVVLHGVNAGGRSKLAPYLPFDFGASDFQAALDAYLDRAASWGLDVFRLPLTWAVPAPAPAPHHDCPSWFLEYVNDADVKHAFDRFWANGGGLRDAYLKLW